MYQQTLGRFQSRDPLEENGFDVMTDTGFYGERLAAMRANPWYYGGNGSNLYAYVSNNPVNYVDPSGLAALLDLAHFRNEILSDHTSCLCYCPSPGPTYVCKPKPAKGETNYYTGTVPNCTKEGNTRLNAAACCRSECLKELGITNAEWGANFDIIKPEEERKKLKCCLYLCVLAVNPEWAKNFEFTSIGFQHVQFSMHYAIVRSLHDCGNNINWFIINKYN